MDALAPAWRQTPASIAPIGGIVVAAVPLAEPPPQARLPWPGAGGRSVAGAIVIVVAIVIETRAPVALARAFIETRAPRALALASVAPIEEFAGQPAAASAAGGRRRSWFLLVEVLFQDKDGRKTPLPEAGAQQEFRRRDDFGGRRHFHMFLSLLLLLLVVYYLLLLVVLGGIRVLLLQLQLLEFLLELFQQYVVVVLFLFAAFPDPLVAKVNQVGRILFDAGTDPSGQLLQSLGIVLVLGGKVLDPQRRVLRQFKALLVVVDVGNRAITTTTMLVLLVWFYKVHLGVVVGVVVVVWA